MITKLKVVKLVATAKLFIAALKKNVILDAAIVVSINVSKYMKKLVASGRSPILTHDLDNVCI